MQKRGYFINNPSSEIIRITELNISLPAGISNLFDLNHNLSYEQIEFSSKHGTLKAAIENGLCYPVPEPQHNVNFTPNVVLKEPTPIQIMPSRTRFAAIKVQDAVVFDAADSVNLFGDEDIKPARQLAEEINKSTDVSEQIAATIKQANIPEKPIENRYITTQEPIVQEKIKNDITMGYVTCDGTTSNGKKCMRRAKKDKLYCGLHMPKSK